MDGVCSLTKDTCESFERAPGKRGNGVTNQMQSDVRNAELCEGRDSSDNGKEFGRVFGSQSPLDNASNPNGNWPIVIRFPVPATSEYSRMTHPVSVKQLSQATS